MVKTTNFLFFLYFIQHARTGRLLGLFVFLLVFLFIFFVFSLIFFYLFFSFFSFFSLFTKSSFDSPGISVSRKVQLLIPSYTSSSDMEFISAGHSSGCSFQRFLCCSIIRSNAILLIDKFIYPLISSFYDFFLYFNIF